MVKKKTKKKIAKEFYKIEKVEKKEKRLFHKYLWPSLIAGVAVAILSIFFEFTEGGLLLFACMGASVAVMVHVPKSKMNSLRAIIVSYITAGLVSIFVWSLTMTYDMMFSFAVFISIFLTTLLILMLDAFHPPAVGAALGFILYESRSGELFLLVGGVLFLLILIKMLEYIRHEKLEIKHFYKEFKREHYGFK